jgi:cell division protein FtsB
MAVLFAVALGYVPYHLYGSSGLARYVKLRRERDALHAANLERYRTNQRLRAELDELSDDDPEGDALRDSSSATHSLSRAAVERAARDELGLVKPGEIVYKVADVPTAALSPTSEAR